MGSFISLHGSLFGIDSITGSIQRPGISSQFSNEDEVTAATTSANIPFRGAATLGSAAGAFTLNAPTAGLRKTITSLTTSTAARTVALASGTFQSTAGSSFTTLTFNGIGQSVGLHALSTALVQVSANSGVTLS